MRKLITGLLLAALIPVLSLVEPVDAYRLNWGRFAGQVQIDSLKWTGIGTTEDTLLTNALSDTSVAYNIAGCEAISLMLRVRNVLTDTLEFHTFVSPDALNWSRIDSVETVLAAETAYIYYPILAPGDSLVGGDKQTGYLKGKIRSNNYIRFHWGSMDVVTVADTTFLEGAILSRRWPIK